MDESKETRKLTDLELLGRVKGWVDGVGANSTIWGKVLYALCVRFEKRIAQDAVNTALKDQYVTLAGSAVVIDIVNRKTGDTDRQYIHTEDPLITKALCSLGWGPPEK